MNPPGSAIAWLAALASARRWRSRWGFVLGALAVCGGLAIFPCQYHASALMVRVTPADSGSAGPPGQPCTDALRARAKTAAAIALATARSAPVRARAARMAHISPALHERQVIIRSARDGLVLVEAHAATRAAALTLVATQVAAMGAELARPEWMPVEPPHADAGVSLRWPPLAVGALLVLLALVVEIYRASPPVGTRRPS